MVVHSAQVYIQLKPLFSRHNGIGVQFTDEPTGNLDTASSIEIMEIFSELHREGATVVVVTHEENIAAFTHRIIRFQDGNVISDEKNPNPTVTGHENHMEGLYHVHEAGKEA